MEAEAARPFPPDPPNEEDRLAVVQAIFPRGGLGDGAPEDPMLQALCKTICKLFEVPIAGVSVVQKNSYSMRACQGLPNGFKVPRRDAFCAWTLLSASPETLVIEDMTKDQRFSEHPNVLSAPGGLRFYAGSPLVSSQYRLGAVCILDVAPRKMTAEEFNVLNNFSEIAIRRLEEKQQAVLRRHGSLLRSEEELSEAVMLCDVRNSRWWNILYANPAFAELTGVTMDQLTDQGFWRLFRPAKNEAKNKVLEQVEKKINNGDDFILQARKRENALDGAASKQVFKMHFRPATRQVLGAHTGKICVPNFVDAVELGKNDPATAYFFAAVEMGDEGEADVHLLGDAATGRRERQETFYSTEFYNNFPVTSKQPVDEGIRDVKLGVLCKQTSDGLVYRGRWRKKPVSVKVTESKKSICVRGPGFGAAYVPREAALTIDLDHPNLIKTYKLVVQNVTVTTSVMAWLVREWAGLGTLTDAIQRGWLLSHDKTPNWRCILALAGEVASGMAYLHEQGIILGWLDSTRVVLAADEGEQRAASKQKDFVAKLADFGMASSSEEAAVGAEKASATHTAPEVFSKGQPSKTSDVYAFGMLWWEMCNSQLVWPSLNSAQIQRKVLSKEAPQMPASFDIGVKALLLDCLANKPSHRPSFAEIHTRLSVMQQQQEDGQKLTGQTERAGRDELPQRKRLTQFPTKKTPPEELKEGKKAPNLLDQMSTKKQTKSLLKRFAEKLKA